MVSETRSLLFSEEEVLCALKVVMQQRGDAPPSAAVPELTLAETKDGELEARITHTPILDGDVSTYTFTAAEVGAALILYCMRLGIPLPKKVDKAVELRGDRAALIIRMETDVRQQATVKLPADA